MAYVLLFGCRHVVVHISSKDTTAVCISQAFHAAIMLLKIPPWRVQTDSHACSAPLQLDRSFSTVRVRPIFIEYTSYKSHRSQCSRRFLVDRQGSMALKPGFSVWSPQPPHPVSRSKCGGSSGEDDSHSAELMQFVLACQCSRSQPPHPAHQPANSSIDTTNILSPPNRSGHRACKMQARICLQTGDKLRVVSRVKVPPNG